MRPCEGPQIGAIFDGARGGDGARVEERDCVGLIILRLVGAVERARGTRSGGVRDVVGDTIVESAREGVLDLDRRPREGRPRPREYIDPRCRRHRGARAREGIIGRTARPHRGYECIRNDRGECHRHHQKKGYPPPKCLVPCVHR